jgi:DNA-binding NtrC family response regulator
VIVCTAATLGPDQQATLLRAHRVHLVLKPFDLDALLDAVRTALHETRR